MAKKSGDRAPDPTILRGRTVGQKDRNANYDFAVQKEPEGPMGHGEFANMPSSPKLMTFTKEHSYRDGIVNSFATGIIEVSDIHENNSKVRPG